MEDFQVIAASALCALSLLNYTNVLKRIRNNNTSSNLPNATPQLQPQPEPKTLRLPKNVTKIRRPHAVHRRPEKKRTIKMAVANKELRTSSRVKSDSGDKRSRRQRRCWMKAIHSDRTISSMDKLFNELTCEDSGQYMKLFPMSRSDFGCLLSKIEPVITKQASRMRMPIPAKMRLAITLRYLAAGDSYRSLRNLFKVSGSIITLIIPEVCEAINNALKDEIKLPQMPEEWAAIAEQFRTKFPHCIGIVHWKRIVSPTNTGDRRCHSSFLLVVVDSDYRFIFADTDGLNSKLWEKLETDCLNLPPETPLPNREMSVPYVFLGDETFALQKHVMVPFAESHIGTIEGTFNYHLSSTRAIADNAFGAMTSVFRIFKKPIDIEKAKVSLVTMTCVLLHNFLRRSETSRNIYNPPGTFDSFDNGVFVEGSWRENTEAGAVRSVQSDDTITSPEAFEIRSEYAEYLDANFNS